jgi:glycosyltransferase involved in cell wall biosynthesis
MTNKKIFFVLEDVSEEYGGPIRSIASLEIFLEQKGFSCHIVHASLNFLSKRKSKFKNTFSFYKSIISLIKTKFLREKVLIIFNNQWTPAVQILGWFCVILNIEYFWWIRGVPNYKSSFKKRIVWGLSQKYLFRNANMIVGSSELSIKRIQGFFSKRLNTLELPNQITFPSKKINDSKLNDNYYFELNLKEKAVEEIIILSIGRIHHTKNLITIIKNLKNNVLDKKVRLVFAGYSNNKSYVEKLKAEARKQDIKIEILENIDNKQKNFLLYLADIFVSMSQIENFGHSIAEALSSGLPVVINKETDFWPYFDFENIYLTDSSNLNEKIEDAYLHSRNKNKEELAFLFKETWREFENKKYEYLLSKLI